MLQDRYETDKLFKGILKLTNTIDPVLAQIDQLLEDEALYQWPEVIGKVQLSSARLLRLLPVSHQKLA